MTTQQTPRALAREAAGLILSACGVFGVLLALGAFHWAAGLSTAMAGLLTAGLVLKPQPDAPHWKRGLRVGVCAVGYGGLTGCAFALSAPLGAICVALAVTAAGLWLITGRESGGA
ncbi:hypothetical protein ACFQ6U_13745 [Streptomyces sp. NPDC056465]|uniref:hypothetical protein n=1 Tax=unclassified Streptomyces TaxID=2593676 RepID=UPI0035DC7E63